MQLDSKFAIVENRKVHYLSAGSGQKMLFIHGHRSDALRWKNVLEILADDFEVIAPDLPGFGQSDEFDSWHSIERYSVFLQKFIKMLYLDNFILTGGSMGTSIALLTTIKIPQKIKRLVLVGPVIDSRFLKLGRGNYLLYLAIVALFAKSKLIQKIADWLIKKDRFLITTLKVTFPKEKRDRKILEYESHQWRVMKIKVWAQSLYSLLTFKFPKIRETFNFPTLLVFARNDQYLDKDKTVSFMKPFFSSLKVSFLNWDQHVPKGEISKEEIASIVVSLKNKFF